MKYRFWPNNKSRMYVLENTGDFVKQKGLKVGDSILLYQDEDEQFFICAKRAEEPPLELLKKELEECKVEHRAHSSERRMMEEDEHCDPFVVLETEVDTQEKVKLGKGKMIMLEDYGCSDNDTCGGSSSTQLGKEVVESQSLNKEAAGDFDCVFSELEMLPNFGACDLSLYNDFMSDFSDPGGENRVVAK
ncbi:PREDICTED: uncharacterized protein LOC104599427 [Nelumbo nucifera]|nr:PREDICTED: uncharacterized protein LOC104599427 [Nelumbo nucifera]